ncbi:hypothetical protein EDC01DRAFT_780716 [Geopyxis carbonaria]|nr:hypothetical protein EDC01DRAFT_780716 [Geopyxis carbonaria]
MSDFQSPESKQEWEGKLKGKKFHDDATTAPQTAFTKKDLPQKNRVVRPGQMMTKDFYEDRLNVHLDEKDHCTHCTFG